MLKLFITITSMLAAAEWQLRARRDERGSVTMEQVLWAVAAIVFVGIVVAAIKAYVTRQAGNIK